MQMPRRRFSLLAIELDGYSPSCVDRARSGVHDTIIVAQQPSESAAKFAARLVERIKRVRADGAIISRASLACNGSVDVDAIAARILVIRTMIAANPDLCDSDVSMTSSNKSSALRHQFEAIRQAFLEHGVRSAPEPSQLEPVAPGSAPLQRVA
jgi:hypothetical protein